MKKLINGIMQFRRESRDAYKDTFAKLALGQKPDALFIACSDSRVAVNVFASSDPGDLFVIRNVGNLVGPCGEDGVSGSDESEGAAIEFALQSLAIRQIILCGHSDCGAMHAICKRKEIQGAPHLNSWLRHAQPAAEGSTDVDEVSRRNVLLQLEHLRSYPLVRQREQEGNLVLHGLWFDIPNLEVQYYEPTQEKFLVIDDEEGANILRRLKG